jgi:hypothetical protein
MLWPDRRDERIRWIVSEYDNQIKSLDWLESDFIPFADLITGTEIFAEALGCEVHRPESTMPFALPLVKTADQASAVEVPEIMDSTLSVQYEIADAVLDMLGEGTLLRLVDIQTPIDIAALIWDKEYFFTSLITEPEAVQTLIGKARDLQVEFLDRWKKQYGDEFIAHYPEYYMPTGITTSEDEIGSISPAMFEEYCSDDLNFLGERYGGLGIHCCADARHQWANFRKIRSLKLLNLNQPSEVLDAAFHFFRNHIALLPIPVRFEKPDTIIPRRDRPNTVYVFNTSTRDEALQLSDQLSTLRLSMAAG